MRSSVSEVIIKVVPHSILHTINARFIKFRLTVPEIEGVRRRAVLNNVCNRRCGTVYISMIHGKNFSAEIEVKFRIKITVRYGSRGIY